MKRTYAATYAASLEDPTAFWADAARGIDWSTPWETVVDRDAEPLARWFVGGRLNTCHNALDRHVASGRADQNALIYDSPMTGGQQTYTYAELLDEVALLAGMLRGQGVVAGDRVLIYMPMIPQAVMAMLACARIGAIHSVVFGGFAPKELATRIDDAKPKLLLMASCGLEPGRVVEYKPLVDAACEISAHAPERCVVFQRDEARAELSRERDADWQTLLASAEPTGCVDRAATDPLYILYTSGTTGVPKGVVRDNGGHAVALHWSLENVYGMKPGDVFWAASDIGWVVGHSYIVYAPLLLGCTTLLYEGKPVGTPDAGAFWRVAAEHGVNALFTAPTAFRAIKRADPEAKLLGDYDLGSLRTLFLAGERADPDTVEWAEQALGIPVIDHWWQTETGWPMASNCIGIESLPIKRGSPTVPVPGYDIVLLDDAGVPIPPHSESGVDEESGNIAVRLPLPPGCLPGLWQNDAGCRQSYLDHFPGYYETGDAGRIDKDGYLWIMSRTDDIINVAGHRLSTGGMEEVLAHHPDVAECAVIGAVDELKGHVPLGFVVLKAGVEREPGEIEAELVQRVRDQIGPVAAFKQVCVVSALPKTRSGKILRGVMRKIADSEPYNMPATIEDPALLDVIYEALQKLGYAQ